MGGYVELLPRRGDADAWENVNPVLVEGELAMELDTRQFKVGDGLTRWKDLPYFGVGTVSFAVLLASIGALQSAVTSLQSQVTALQGAVAALQSSPAFQQVSGTAALGSGVDHGSVTGLGLAFSPTKAVLWVSRPTGSLNVDASLVAGSVSSDGFSFELSGATDSTSYVLNYLILP